MTLPINNTFTSRADREILSQNKLFFGTYLNMAQHNTFLMLTDSSEKVGKTPPSSEGLWKDAGTFSLLNTQQRPSIRSKAGRLAVKQFVALESLVIEREEGEAETPPDVEKLHDFLYSALELLNNLRREYSHYYHETAQNIDYPKLEAIFREAKRVAIERLPKDDDKAKNKAEKKIVKYMLRNEDEKLVFFISLFLSRQQAEAFMSQINDFKGEHNALKRRVFAQLCCRLPRPKLESAALELDALNELARCPDEVFRYLNTEDKNRFVVPLKELDKDDTSGNTITLKRYEDRLPYLLMRYLDEHAENFGIHFQIWAGKLRTADYPKTIYDIEDNRNIHENLTAYDTLQNLRNGDNIPDNWKMQDGELLTKIEQFSPHYNIINNRIALKLGDTAYTEIYPLSEDSKLDFRVKNPLPDLIISTYDIPNLFLYQYLHQQGKIRLRPDIFIRQFSGKLRKVFKDVQSGELKPLQAEAFEKQQRYSERRQEILEERRSQLQAILDNKYKLVKVSHLPDALREYLFNYKAQDFNRQVLHKITERMEADWQRKKKAEYGSGTDEPELKAGNIGTYIARDIVALQPPNPQEVNLGKPNNDQYNELQESIAYFGREYHVLPAYLRKELGVMGERNDKTKHPFLVHLNWNKCHTAKEFYIEYLDVKRRWMRAVRDDIKAVSPQTEQPHFVKMQRNAKHFGININKSALTDEQIQERYGYFLRINSKAAKDRNYLKTMRKNPISGDFEPTDNAPIMLPRGIFNDAIREALRTNYPDQINDKSGMSDFTRIMANDEDLQTCYSYPRHYRYEADNDKLFKNDREKARHTIDIKGDTAQIWQGLCDLKTELKDNLTRAKNSQLKRLFEQVDRQKKLWRRIFRNEQAIRTVAFKDRLVWLMVKDILTRKSQAEQSNLQLEQWQLQDTGFDVRKTEVWILDQAIPTSLTIHDKDICANFQSAELDKARENELPVKRYGEFRKMLKDRRLFVANNSGLLRYYPEKSILWTTLQDELRDYDQCRAELLNAIFAFEQRVLSNQQCRQHLSLTENRIDHKVYLEAYKATYGNMPQPISNINQLRNKFMHNQIPYDTWISQAIEHNTNANLPIEDHRNKNVVKQLIEFATELYDGMNEILFYNKEN